MKQSYIVSKVTVATTALQNETAVAGTTTNDSGSETDDGRASSNVGITETGENGVTGVPTAVNGTELGISDHEITTTLGSDGTVTYNDDGTEATNEAGTRYGDSNQFKIWVETTVGGSEAITEIGTEFGIAVHEMMTIDGYDGMNSTYDDGTDSTNEAGTMNGETNDQMITWVGTVAITVDGTESGTSVHETITTDGSDGMVTTSIEVSVETHETGTATGDVHVAGMVTVGTVMMLLDGIDSITTVGTDSGTNEYEIIATDGDYDMVMYSQFGSDETNEIGTATGDVHEVGTATTVGATTKLDGATVTMTDSGTETITVAGTELGTSVISTITADG